MLRQGSTGEAECFGGAYQHRQKCVAASSSKQPREARPSASVPLQCARSQTRKRAFRTSWTVVMKRWSDRGVAGHSQRNGVGGGSQCCGQTGAPRHNGAVLTVSDVAEPVLWCSVTERQSRRSLRLNCFHKADHCFGGAAMRQRGSGTIALGTLGMGRRRLHCTTRTFGFRFAAPSPSPSPSHSPAGRRLRM